MFGPPGPLFQRLVRTAPYVGVQQPVSVGGALEDGKDRSGSFPIVIDHYKDRNATFDVGRTVFPLEVCCNSLGFEGGNERVSLG